MQKCFDGKVYNLIASKRYMYTKDVQKIKDDVQKMRVDKDVRKRARQHHGDAKSAAGEFILVGLIAQQTPIAGSVGL